MRQMAMTETLVDASAGLQSACQSEKKKETKTKSKSKGEAQSKTTKADPKADVAKAETKAVKLTKEQAKEALSKAVAILDKQENKKKLKKVVDACGDDAAKKMAALMPMVKDLLAELLESYGFSGDRILQAVMQIAGHAEGDKKRRGCKSLPVAFNMGNALVELDGRLFQWSDSEEETETGLRRRLFAQQYLSRHCWIRPSRNDVKASLLGRSQRINADEVLEALRRIPTKHWRNSGRANVRPEGINIIDSITLGLVSCASTQGRPLPARRTRLYENLCKLLLRFWKQHIQEEQRQGNIPGCQGLVCTSIQMNRNYAAREHVDGNNLGPSWIIALGDWSEGGELFVEDPWGRESHMLSCDIPGQAPQRFRKGDVCRGTFLDVHRRWARFDGRRMHFVRPFQGGDRFSLVFFAATRHSAAPAAARSFLSVLGFPLPEGRDPSSECRCSTFGSALKVDELGRAAGLEVCFSHPVHILRSPKLDTVAQPSEGAKWNSTAEGR
ncbi:unnamed protein product [Effrenium voratum]|uniref:Protein C10 n=1 Tax=Effrenium voratum TaxID=2562239 RepID=A0AA36I2F4_9DINO|nr:unnamed protein product [Effrenium voratum]